MTDLISRPAVIEKLKVAYWDKNIQSAKNDPCIIDAMTDWAIRQVKEVPSSNPWHTETPTEEGWYLCWVSFTKEIAPMVYKWKNGKFMLTDIWESDDDILMWQKIEPYEEKEK